MKRGLEALVSFAIPVLIFLGVVAVLAAYYGALYSSLQGLGSLQLPE